MAIRPFRLELGMPNSTVAWQQPSDGNSSATVRLIEHFNARGMRRVYGRCDHFHRSYNMDIWRDRDSRLLVRFWSRSDEVDDESWEIIGAPDTRQLSSPPFDEAWIANCLREKYDEWVIANF
jgi:hypothetical protein